MWLLAVCTCMQVYGQTSTAYYYYYKGEKLYLTLDLHNIAVTSEEQSGVNAIETYVAGYPMESIASTSNDPARSVLQPTDEISESRHRVKTFYTEIHLDQNLDEPDYLNRVGEYHTISGVVSTAPCFILPGGGKAGLMNTIMVQLKNADDLGDLYAQAAAYNAEVIGYHEYAPLWIMLATGNGCPLNAMQLANILYETGMFENAEPMFMNHIVPASDQFSGLQWAVMQLLYPTHDIDAEEAWTITKGNPNIKVGVFDEGIQANHPDLQNNILGPGFDLVTLTASAQVYGPHGTSVAGIIAAEQDNTIGVAGVAPQVKLVSISCNYSQLTGFSTGMGFLWAAISGIDVLNCSWGGGAPSIWINFGIAAALAGGRNGKGTVIVFSSGNSDGPLDYPANSNPLILCVGGTDECGVRSGRAGFVPNYCTAWPWAPGMWASNYGPELDVVAGGTSIATTDLTGASGYTNTDYETQFFGTSAAAPFVSGVAALMLSANPDFTVQNVNYFIEITAKKLRTDIHTYSTNVPGRPNGGWDGEMGYGFLNAALATGFASMALCGTNPPNMTVTTNVNAPSVSTLQTSNSITLSHAVANGAAGRYHAGSIVSMTAGFSAAGGSIFSAYIQGCNAAPFNKAGNTEELTPYYTNLMAGAATLPEKKSDEVKATAISEEKISVYPNPNEGSFILTVNNNSPKIIRIYDVLNNLILQKETKEQQTGIDISGHASGIYFVHILYGNTVKVERVLFQQ
jgi:subtilisin family serine protease